MRLFLFLDLALKNLLRQKLDWIQEKLSLQLNKKKKINWKTGELIHILGNKVILSLKASKTNSVLQDKDILHVDTNRVNDQVHSAKLVSKWLKEKALKDFVRRVEVFSVKLNVHPSSVYLSNAKSRWGSCNSKREIRLNWRLIQAPPHIINYVICHELAHLKEMNHSNRFWEEVEKSTSRISLIRKRTQNALKRLVSYWLNKLCEVAR
jgi:predicted metal-dependent hydrolase